MKKGILILTVMVMGTIISMAQQDPHFSQYMFNYQSFNPGYSGSQDMICLSALNRQQWVGFSNRPEVTVMNVHTPFRLFGTSHGAGLSILRDVIGFDKNLGIQGAYAYKLDIGPGRLSMGLNLGIQNRILDPEWNIPTGEGFSTPEEDELIPTGKESQVIFDMGVGIWYQHDRLFAGISSTHLNEPSVRYTTTSGESYLARHYYLAAGYSFLLPNPLFEITPSALVQTDGKITHTHLNLMLLYNKKLWGGVSFRPGEAIVAMIGMELFNGIRVGYSYDYATTSLQNYSGGSHELMLSYCFSIRVERTPERYKSVRFL
ncbi:MAG TPA: type IX secretion system membrane protein PorP/SprF [Bacteroidetes bacterium]|nr:type IX secretion system membrane protein PorP/SprF [Bacteroidota bacterium]